MNTERTCFLPPSGFTFTKNEVYDWLRNIVRKIKSEIGDDHLVAYCWAYRVGDDNQELLAFDIGNDKDEIFPLAFCPVAQKHGYQLGDVVDVPDLIDAWHMIGMLTQAMNIDVRIGVTGNELNEYCTDKWVHKNQTNARMKLTF